MHPGSSIAQRVLVSALALSALAGVAHAGIVGQPLTISVSSSLGTASHTIFIGDDQDPSPTGFSYDFAGSLDLTSGSNTIAQLTSLSLSFQDDPMIFLDFNVTAGGADTTITFTTGTLSFSPLFNPTAVASGGLTVTDNSGNGGWANPASGANAHYAYYNGGSIYAQFIGPISFLPPFNTGDANGNFPGAIAGNVSDMHVVRAFTLSANDSASGTSSYVIVPAPAGLGLLGLAGLMGSRRRR